MTTTEPFPATRCTECHELFGHQPTVCRLCGSEELHTADIGGEGYLYASTVVRVPGSESQGEEPYQVGIVDVGNEETVRVTARISTEEKLPPETPVEFIGTDGGAFIFRPA